MKQNMLSRCEEVEMKSYICFLDGKMYTVEGLSEAEAKKALRVLLNVAKLPRGVQVIENKEEVEGAI